MMNFPDSGFNPAKIDTVKPEELIRLVRRMSCEELLTCRVLTRRQCVCTAIQRELLARLEVGDKVEVVSGLEKVARVRPGYVLIEGRGKTKYGYRYVGFYVRSILGGNKRTYSCDLKGVRWSMNADRRNDCTEFCAFTWNLDRQVLSDVYKVEDMLEDDDEFEEQLEDDHWDDEEDAG